MVRLNKTRVNYLDQFQKLIDEYNSGAINIEIFFKQLVNFAKNLNDDEKRVISENLSEEELALFDTLSNPNLNNKERTGSEACLKEASEGFETGEVCLGLEKETANTG